MHTPHRYVCFIPQRLDEWMGLKLYLFLQMALRKELSNDFGMQAKFMVLQ